MIQTYVHIMDLNPTEPIHDIVGDERHEPHEYWTKEDLKADIKKNGIKFMFQIDSEGNIMNGNARYHIAKELFLEGDMRFEYLPVELAEMSGKFFVNFEDTPQVQTLGDVLKYLLEANYLVIKPQTEFREYTINKDNPKVYDNFDVVKARGWNMHIVKQNEGYGVLYHKISTPPEVEIPEKPKEE